MSYPNQGPRDLYQEVTDRIVAALEQGVAPWIQPWAAGTGFPRNGRTGRPYHGLNVLLLWLTAQERGYTSQEWFTFNQAMQACGYRREGRRWTWAGTGPEPARAGVRKGERGTVVTFWKILPRRDEQGTDGGNRRGIPLLRHFVVFNRAQVDGLPPSRFEAPRHDWEPIEEAEAFVRGTGARVIVGGSVAGYSLGADAIGMPALADFAEVGAYYATLLHELAHWTGHPSRLDRDLSGAFGSPSYAREELVAEMGGAFLCVALGIRGQLQHPEYIAFWLNVLREDKRAIFHAASQARQVAEYLGAVPPASDMAETEEGEDAPAVDAAA
jgi:antirestriction protein ArdC